MPDCFEPCMDIVDEDNEWTIIEDEKERTALLETRIHAMEDLLMRLRDTPDRPIHLVKDMLCAYDNFDMIVLYWECFDVEDDCDRRKLWKRQTEI